MTNSTQRLMQSTTDLMQGAFKGFTDYVNVQSNALLAPYYAHLKQMRALEAQYTTALGASHESFASNFLSGILATIKYLESIEALGIADTLLAQQYQNELYKTVGELYSVS